MTDTNTCNMSVERGFGRKRHHEFCGRPATHVDRAYGVNFTCKRHSETRLGRWARRQGTLVPLS